MSTVKSVHLFGFLDQNLDITAWLGQSKASVTRRIKTPADRGQ